jgi:hypothetical protein
MGALEEDAIGIAAGAGATVAGGRSRVGTWGDMQSIVTRKEAGASAPAHQPHNPFNTSAMRRFDPSTPSHGPFSYSSAMIPR